MYLLGGGKIVSLRQLKSDKMVDLRLVQKIMTIQEYELLYETIKYLRSKDVYQFVWILKLKSIINPRNW